MTKNLSDQIVGIYERNAQGFDAGRGKVLLERHWLERFLAAAPAGGDVLDIGCGSGEPIARFLIGQGRAVTGVDSSPAMIGMCEARFPQQNWIVADMRRLALGRRFGGILAWHSFFHLPRDDQRAMFPVFRAHAMEGAALMFTSGPSDGEAIGSCCNEALYHASLSADEYTHLLRSNGFAVLDHVVEDRSCGGATVWLARADESVVG